MKYILAVFTAALWLAASASAAPAGKCIQIFYDRVPAQVPEYRYGRLHALYLQNLLGHFPQYQQYIIPIEAYQAGQIERCDANIYIGTYFDNPIPNTFLDDFTITGKAVAWLGYNTWRLGNARLKQNWGATYRGLSGVDWAHLDLKGKPGFFADYDYKGETFTKYSEVNPQNPNTLIAAYEVTLLEVDPSVTDVQVLSTARHSTRNQQTPYILRRGNRWFVADSPFSFITQEDRYLIFSDLLFDILAEKPLHKGAHPALVRFEDIHPQLPLWQIESAFDAAEKVGIPFAMSIIPNFRDPYQVLVKDPANMNIRLDDRPQFVTELKNAAHNKGSFVFHGFTHQFETLKNPLGISGLDFEFWDATKNQSLTTDTAASVIQRLESGFSILNKAGVKPSAWLTPHYAASPLDNIIFGQTFLWTIGRVSYYPFQAKQGEALPTILTFDVFGMDGNGERLKYFNDLKVDYAQDMGPSGQFFPYEVYGDVYGQRVIPENVGFLVPQGAPGNFNVDDMLRILKRNTVIRDSWGSFFIHPYLIRGKGETKEIERLFQGALDLNYKFVNLKNWTRSQLKAIRLPPIETVLSTTGAATFADVLANPILGTLRMLTREMDSRSRELPLTPPNQRSGCAPGEERHP